MTLLVGIKAGCWWQQQNARWPGGLYQPMKKSAVTVRVFPSAAS
jgi:hypothetical protein